MRLTYRIRQTAVVPWEADAARPLRPHLPLRSSPVFRVQTRDMVYTLSGTSFTVFCIDPTPDGWHVTASLWKHSSPRGHSRERGSRAEGDTRSEAELIQVATRRCRQHNWGQRNTLGASGTTVVDARPPGADESRRPGVGARVPGPCDYHEPCSLELAPAAWRRPPSVASLVSGSGAGMTTRVGASNRKAEVPGCIILCHAARRSYVPPDHPSSACTSLVTTPRPRPSHDA